MNEEIFLHFERSDEFMKDAELLFANQRYASSIGRAYYAMFHAATAVLMRKGIVRKSHRAIISAFGEYLVKPGLIDYKFHKYLMDTFDLRQESDYQPVMGIDSQQTEETICQAKEFVEACRQLHI
jgi:uncharacterized protein